MLSNIGKDKKKTQELDRWILFRFRESTIHILWTTCIHINCDLNIIQK